MRYDVDTDALRASVDAVEAALSRLERLGLADDLSRVAAAFPGGRTSSLASQVCLAWQTRLSETRWVTKSLGSHLAAAAATYDAVESGAQRAFVRTRAVANTRFGCR